MSSMWAGWGGSDRPPLLQLPIHYASLHLLLSTIKAFNPAIWRVLKNKHSYLKHYRWHHWSHWEIHSKCSLAWHIWSERNKRLKQYSIHLKATRDWQQWDPKGCDHVSIICCATPYQKKATLTQIEKQTKIFWVSKLLRHQFITI